MTKEHRHTISDFSGEAPWASLKRNCRLIEYFDEVIVPRTQRIGSIVLHKLVDAAGNFSHMLPKHKNEQ